MDKEPTVKMNYLVDKQDTAHEKENESHQRRGRVCRLPLKAGDCGDTAESRHFSLCSSLALRLTAGVDLPTKLLTHATGSRTPIGHMLLKKESTASHLIL